MYDDPFLAKSFTRYDRKRLGCCAFFVFTIGICSTFKPHLHPFTSIGDHEVNLHLPMSVIPEPTVEMKKTEPICRILEAGVDYCEMEGDIRIDANSSTIFLVTSAKNIVENSTTSWGILPYPRRGITHVKKWTVAIVGIANKFPKCTENHKSPATLFSTGGYSGNLFHDFADLILPLYVTSFDFKRNVNFLASDYNSWWISKFHGILEKFTRYEVIDIDREKQEVHCYKKMVVGLNFHRELIVDPTDQTRSGLSMSNFRQLIREAYSLERTRILPGQKPRIMIITRTRTRILMNPVEASQTARRLGFEVVLAEADSSTSLSRFAQLVNSCDVLMGVHGAGLTNMVFLPENAIVIQVVPFGLMDWLPKNSFGDSSTDMKLKYLHYKVGVKESSLSLKYSSEDPVLKDPSSIHSKGWLEMRSIYLDNQNITIDIDRFKSTLVEALELLSQ